MICLVTPPVRTADEIADLLLRIGCAAQAGVHLVQVRQPDMEGGALARLVAGTLAAVRGTRARVLVNDRLDVALTGGAHGVQLRGRSMPAARVRQVAPAGFLVGRSVHALEEGVEAASAGGLDFLVFGTVFATASKPSVTPAGVAALASLCAAVPVPVLAIGGITPARLGDVKRAGAAGFAAIDLFASCPADHLDEVVRGAAGVFGDPS
jgi:thiamine-phosphate diphosphorylase